MLSVLFDVMATNRFKSDKLCIRSMGLISVGAHKNQLHQRTPCTRGITTAVVGFKIT